MLAMVAIVETVDKMAMAKEVMAEVPMQPCLGRHQRLVPARIKRGTFSPSASETTARKVICSTPQ
jgi:hypothetical protein